MAVQVNTGLFEVFAPAMKGRDAPSLMASRKTAGRVV